MRVPPVPVKPGEGEYVMGTAVTAAAREPTTSSERNRAPPAPTTSRTTGSVRIAGRAEATYVPCPAVPTRSVSPPGPSETRLRTTVTEAPGGSPEVSGLQAPSRFRARPRGPAAAQSRPPERSMEKTGAEFRPAESLRKKLPVGRR
ncbi:MAG: hypothetical protein IPL90_17145 [Holophagales bacterium]|nr:hypothetical protein [Holophagales bacterium]